jgi:hypothetical protein
MGSVYHWKDGAGFFIPGMLLLIVINAIIPASAQAQENEEQGQTSASSLFIALFANGDALVEHNVGIEDPLAQEIRIKLFGDDIHDLIAVDYEDNAVEFKRGETSNEIVLSRPNASNLKISYTTPDFLSKDRREWIFSLNSTISVSVKLPPDSILTDPGENPSIVLVGDQQLLTYKPGNIRFVYVIGTLGTQEQANIVINAAETTIVQINNNYPGIVLTSAKDLLQRAIDARDDSMFTDAERLADQANDAAIDTGREYAAAQDTLAGAEAQINNAAGSRGSDIAVITQMLDQANNEFAIGNYTEARNSAQDAVTALNAKPAQPEIPIPVMIAAIIAAAAAAGGTGTIVVLLRKRRRHSKSVPQVQKAEDLQNPHANNSNITNRTPAAVFHPTRSVAPGERKQDAVEVEEQQEMAESRDETSIPPIPSPISESQTDSSILSHIVGNILVEKPHLRPEDQQVLKFLAEKEGAAFESEVRSKFQLPRTTIWRLIKRLEREELVEIRKAGGQNLIKLRFEDKQT